MMTVHADVPHVNAPPLGTGQLERGHLKPRGNAKFMGPKVRGAPRQDANRHVGSYQAVHDLAYRSIPSTGDDYAVSFLGGGAGQLRGLTAMGFLADHHVPSLGSEGCQDGREIKLSAARARVGDQTRSHRLTLREPSQAIGENTRSKA